MDAYSHYRTQAVTTASPAQLVAMLYQGALTAVEVADEALRTDRGGPQAHDELLRAQAILNELVCSLDHERGGEVARNLAALYDFCLDRLVRANLDKDPAPLEAVRSTLTDLADAWSTMMRENAPTSEPVLAAS